MSIELPKDAEGREIPLDTVVLFNRDGNVYSIVRWTFTTDFDLSDGWSNKWRAITDFCKGWENARGCRIEHDAAVAYGLEVLYED